MRDMCHCGHDLATHYIDRTGVVPRPCACLAPACDCAGYLHEDQPKPPARLTRPRHINTCQCARCKEYAAANVLTIPDDERDTEPPAPW